MTEHSPLGASGAFRWIKCPGSVQQSQGIVEDDADFRVEGTGAHDLAAICLRAGEYRDAWTMIGQKVEGDIPVDKEMADAVQTYIDWVRLAFPDARVGKDAWVEHHFRCPTIHKYFWGTTDFAYLQERLLHVADYKHGAGIIVEAEGNPQLMYYAAGLLESLGMWDKVDTVRLYIVQPRGFHHDGPIRGWEIGVKELVNWLNEVLVPAMDHALVSRETVAGEHCRFCPARGRACPAMAGILWEFENMVEEFAKGGSAEPWTNEQIGRFLQLNDIAKIAMKAINEEGFKRLQGGKYIPGRKLVDAKAYRVWKDGAEGALKQKFGKDAYEPQKLRSPAQIETLPEGKAMTARYAYKPPAGMAMVATEDARRARQPQSTKSFFTKKEG